MTARSSDNPFEAQAVVWSAVGFRLLYSPVWLWVCKTPASAEGHCCA